MLQLQSADAYGESMALLGSPECDLPVNEALLQALLLLGRADEATCCISHQGQL